LSKLGQLLSHLDRPDVTELIFRSGTPAVMQVGSRKHPLTVAPLSLPQIRRFFGGSPVLELLPEGNEVAAQTHHLELEGLPYSVTIGGSATEVEIRVAHGKAAKPAQADASRSPGPERDLVLEPESPSIPGLERGGIPVQSPAYPPKRPRKPTPAPAPINPRSGASIRPRTPTPTPQAPPLRSQPAAIATGIESSSPRAEPGLLSILRTARTQGASDVHIMSDHPVRVRRAGSLEPTGEVIAAAEIDAMVKSLLHGRHAEQLSVRGYADLGLELEGAGRLRINVNRQRSGLKICVRLVVSEPPTMEMLGLPTEVHKLTTQHQGLVIISGPNGHGKTTTMAALVDLFNAGKSVHIITVEDPVEVIHAPKMALVTQREVGTHTRSFQSALAAALREDPDVIAIGELRDRETVEMALSAAETGHLVLATMSTPSGAKTIDRVIDMFPPDDQSQVRATLSGALKLVISQRLLRRADNRGLIAAYEMITGNVPLWTLIRDNKLFQLPSLLQRGRNYGMIRLEDSLRELLMQGIITEDEARLHAEDPRALAPPSVAEAPPSKASGWRFGRGR